MLEFWGSGEVDAMGPMRLRRGFTVLEMTIALLLGLLLISGVWLLLEHLDRQRRVTQAATDLTEMGVEIQADLRRVVGRAGDGLLSSYNWGAVNVIPSERGEGANDTLIVFHGGMGSTSTSTRGCGRLDGDCLALQGDVSDWLKVGDLFVVGSPSTGARLLQAVELSGPYLRACGTDCPPPLVTCDDLEGGALYALVATGSMVHHPDETVSHRNTTCAQAYLPGEGWCEELMELQAVGTARSNGCIHHPPADQLYTDVRWIDRSAQFGYPPLATTTLRSGADGVPAIWAQKVGFARYWVETLQTGGSSLVKQVRIEEDGTWGPALPLFQGVISWEVRVQVAGSSFFERRIPADSAALVLSPNNPNWTENLNSPLALPLRYRDIAAVKITYQLRAGTTPSGQEEPASETFSTIIATPAILEGGVLY